MNALGLLAMSVALVGCAAKEAPQSAVPGPILGGGAGGGGGGGAATAPDLGAAPLGDLAPPPVADLAPPPPPPVNKTLDFAWQGEQVSYYCGPSAARMALSTRLANPPSQDELARFMGTTSNGTDYIGYVQNALNHYLGVTSYQLTALPNDPPSAAEEAALRQHLVASIDAGYGLVAAVVSGWRPPGYPTGGTIYHYIALVGYDKSGELVEVADPAATGCGSGHCGDAAAAFGTVPRSYWIATHDLAVWITPHGYTWNP